MPLHPGYEWQDEGADGELRRVRKELPEVLRLLEDHLLEQSVLEVEVSGWWPILGLVVWAGTQPFWVLCAAIVLQKILLWQLGPGG